MYTFARRTLPDPFLAAFDAPDGSSACPARLRTNTPIQALSLMNEPVLVEAARALARSTAAEVDGASRPGPGVIRVFRACLAREPSPVERSALEHLFRDVAEDYLDRPAEAARLAGLDPSTKGLPEAAAWFVVARTVLNLDEFITRE
jgi:hypothetical protein